MRRRLILITVLGAVLAAVAAAGALAATIWSAPQQLDTAAPSLAGASLAACLSNTVCIGDSETTQGPIAYHLGTGTIAPQAFVSSLTVPFGSGDNDTALTGLQCPDVSECVGTQDALSDEGDDDDVVTSLHPAAGPSSWIPQDVNDPPIQLSCPSTAFCAGATPDGNIASSIKPGGGTTAWKAVKLPAEILEVSCASAEFCAALDGSGNVWTSADPGGTAAAWIKSPAPAPLAAAATMLNNDDNGEGPVSPLLSCAGANLCVAALDSGVAVSTDPSGGTWTPVNATPGQVAAVYCEPGTTSCLAGDFDGNIASTQDGGTTWTNVAAASSTEGILSLSCTAAKCIAATAQIAKGGYPAPAVNTAPLVATMPPAGGTWQWSPVTVPTHDAPDSIACPSSKECVTADDERFYTTANPAKGVSSWHSISLAKVKSTKDDDNADVACYSATACLSVFAEGGAGFADVSGGSLFRFDPVGGAHAFTDTKVGDGTDFQFVSCAQGTCVGGFPGNWFTSSDPGVRTTWHRVKNPRFDVTCLTANTSCVALGNGPFAGVAGSTLLVAAKRTGPWKSEAIDPGGEIMGLACTSAKACAVVDAGGAMYVSSHPTAGPTAWKLADTDFDGFNGVACETASTCVAVDTTGRIVVGHP